MTLVPLIGARLLIHSCVRLTSVSPGLESSGRDGVVQIVKVTLPPRLYDEPERIHAFARPVMRVVQMHDQRAQRQLLLAAFRTSAHHALRGIRTGDRAAAGGRRRDRSADARRDCWTRGVHRSPSGEFLVGRADRGGSPVQSGARCGGIAGIHGNPGTLESLTY
jgi:hypothetical protein